MASFNRVMLIGNLTRDPELRYTTSGKAVCEIGLAVNDYRGSGEDRKQETTFVDITAWEQQAELIAKSLSKGDPIFVEGRLKLDQWEAKDGERRSKLKVVLGNFQFLKPKEGGQQGAPASSQQRQTRPPPSWQKEPAQPFIGEDDIPF